MFKKIVSWRSIADAGSKISDAQLVLRLRRIFIPDDVRLEFKTVIDLAHGAQIERRLQAQHPHIPRSEWGGAVTAFVKDSDASIERLANVVSKRLFRNEALVK